MEACAGLIYCNFMCSIVLQFYVQYYFVTGQVKDFNLISATLLTLYKKKHSFSLKIMLERTYFRWNTVYVGVLKQHQICSTTDSSANVVNAVKKLDWSRLTCFDHNFHLGVTKTSKSDSRYSQVLIVCHKTFRQLEEEERTNKKPNKPPSTTAFSNISVIIAHLFGWQCAG